MHLDYLSIRLSTYIHNMYVRTLMYTYTQKHTLAHTYMAVLIHTCIHILYVSTYIPRASASINSGYLDLVQRLEFGVDHLQINAVYQIE